MSLLSRRYFAAAFFGVTFLLLMLLMYSAPKEFLALDTRATGVIQPLQTFTGVEAFIAITTLGSTTGIIVLALGLVYFWRKERIAVRRLLIALVGSSACVQVVKAFIERVRPPALPWLSTLHSYSFPSGHSTSAMALYGSIALFCFARAKGTFEKLLSILVPSLLIFLIGMSRLVLSAHYLSDVIGGFVLGAFWLSFSYCVFAKRRT